PAPCLRDVRSDAPAELEAVLLRCFEKDADRRFPTVAHFAEALRPFATETSRLSIDRIVATVGVAALPEERARRRSEVTQEQRRKGAAIRSRSGPHAIRFLGGAVAVAAPSLLVQLFVPAAPPPRPTPAPAPEPPRPAAVLTAEPTALPVDEAPVLPLP